MGGRGTFARGNNTSIQYKVVGKIAGVKVLQRIDGKTGFPVEAYSSSAYIQMHPDGTFKMYREYDKDHYLVREVAYHPEPSLTGNLKPVLHIHFYKRDDFDNRNGRLLTPSEYNEFKKYFVGIAYEK